MDKQPAIHVAVILLFLVGLSVYGLYAALHPVKMHSDNTPAEYGIQYENVEFKTADGIEIRGWFVPAENPHAPAVILTHGYGGDMGDLLSSRIFLHNKYNLLFFDFRYFGISGGNHSTAGREEVADLEAAIKFLQGRGIEKVAVWGLSMGAAVALMTAEKQEAIKAVISEASYARLSMLATHYFKIPILQYPLGWMMRYWAYLYLGYDVDSVTPEAASKLLRIPIFYMHSKSDDVVPYKNMKVLEKAAKENPQAKFYIYDNEAHGQLPADYQNKIGSFLKNAFQSE